METQATQDPYVQSPRYEGKSIRMDGRDWIVPPMNLKLVRKVQPMARRIAELGGAGDEAIDLMIQVIQLAMSRNYPAITLDYVEELVDMVTLFQVFEAVMNVSGFEHRENTPGGALAVE